METQEYMEYLTTQNQRAEEASNWTVQNFLTSAKDHQKKKIIRRIN